MTETNKSIDEQRLELERTVHEAHKAHNKKSIWLVPLIGGLVSLLGVVFTVWNTNVLEHHRIALEADGKAHQENLVNLEGEQNLANIEASKLMDLYLATPTEEHAELFCEFFDKNIYPSTSAQNKLAAFTNNFQDCFDLAEERALAAKLESKRAECNKKAIFITGSCRAYDKSGFNSKPSASCGIKLAAGVDKNGEARFFGQDKVEVVSEYYRKRSGRSAVSAMIPQTPEGKDYVTSFSGRIGCSNDRGTGRTCEAKATVRAKSYPLTCLGKI